MRPVEAGGMVAATLQGYAGTLRGYVATLQGYAGTLRGYIATLQGYAGALEWL